MPRIEALFTRIVMEKISLSSAPRSSAKNSALRASQKVPAVVYGHNVAAQSIEIGYSDMLRTYRKAHKTHIVDLTVDGKAVPCLIHDIQMQPVSDEIVHVDFFAVNMKEEITVSIPLVLTGNAPVVGTEGALIEQTMHELEVKCLPADLVDSFTVDISGMTAIGDVIHVSDLKIDTSKFEVLAHAEEAIVVAQAPRKIEEEEVTVVADVTQVATVTDEKKAERDAAKEADKG